MQNAIDDQSNAPPNLLRGITEPIWFELDALNNLANHAAELRRAVLDHYRLTAIVEHNRRYTRIRRRETEEAVADLQNARHRIQGGLIGLDRCQGILTPVIRSEFGRQDRS